MRREMAPTSIDVGVRDRLTARFGSAGASRLSWSSVEPSTPVTSSLPLFLLDVDGVLNPYAAPACPPGYTEHELFPGEEPVRICAAHGHWLGELATRFQLVWATAWGAEANRLLAPLLQLPGLPVIGFPPPPFHPGDKLRFVIDYAGNRPLTWVDDQLLPHAYAWAASRRAPTLLIGIDPAEGLTRPVIDQSLRWADNQPIGGGALR